MAYLPSQRSIIAADVITHGIDGFVIPIRSAEAIAERLELLYRDKELRQEMSRAALAKARSEMSWETYASRLCACYQSRFDREKRESSRSEMRWRDEGPPDRRLISTMPIVAARSNRSP